jgi:acyl-CoA synthetase (AMP-forming)/AMP-acid ligase II
MAQHYFGGTVVMTEKFDAEQNLALIQQYQVSHAHWVPTMMVRILKLPELVRRAYDVSSLRFVMSGAAPISVSTKQTMIDWLGPILEEAYNDRGWSTLGDIGEINRLLPGGTRRHQMPTLTGFLPANPSP